MSFRFALAAAAAVLVVPTAAQADSVFGSNLIVNGDAESGTGSPGGDTVVPVPGFTTTGNFTVALYDSSIVTPANGGNNYFAGGPDNAASSATQSIDVSSGMSAIDLGTASYTLSALLGGYYSQEDNAVLSATFVGVAGPLGSATIGPVTAAERGDVTSLVARSTSGVIPIGTRSITVTLNMTRENGSYNDGYADNLSLVLGAPAAGAVPEPASWAMMIGGLGLAGAALRRRRQVTTVRFA